MKKVRPVCARNYFESTVTSKTKFANAIIHINLVKKDTSISLPVKLATTGTNG